MLKLLFRNKRRVAYTSLLTAVFGAGLTAPSWRDAAAVGQNANNSSEQTSTCEINEGSEAITETRADLVARLREERRDIPPVSWLPATASLAQVQQDLARDNGVSNRADLLIQYARTRAGIGRFDLACTVYEIFLQEFGATHPFAGKIKWKQVVDTAPLRRDSYSILFAPSGPVFLGRWEAQFQPPDANIPIALSLAQAYATEHAGTREAAKALDQMGWLYRWLDQWENSDNAFANAANACPESRESADALWELVTNYALRELSSQELSTLKAFEKRYPTDRRRASVAARIASLSSR